MTVVDFIIGTRPEATKIWLFATELARQCDCRVRLVFSGQHVPLLEGVIADLGPPPGSQLIWLNESGLPLDVDWRPGFRARIQHHWGITPPAFVCVTGDTDSARLAAEEAKKRSVPVVHAEAGIRHVGNYERMEPEEANRREITKLAELHLAPTEKEKANLAAAGVPDSNSVVVGDLSCCAVSMAMRSRKRRMVDEGVYSASGAAMSHERFAMCTFHRSTSLWDQTALLENFTAVSEDLSHMDFIVVGRDDTRWFAFFDSLRRLPNVRVVAPFLPSECISVVIHSEMIITDSAGLQQEALLLEKPTIACRREIELGTDDSNLTIVHPPFHDLHEAVLLSLPPRPQRQGDRSGRLTSISIAAMATVQRMISEVRNRLGVKVISDDSG